MTPTKKFLYHTAAYTVVTSFLFLIFAKAVGVSELYLSFSRYITILALSMVTAATESIFTLNKIPRACRFIIHYAVLAVAFFFIFLSIRSSDGTYQFNTTSIFASLVIFSVFYFLILGSVMLYKKLSKRENGKAPTETKTKPYTSKFQ